MSIEGDPKLDGEATFLLLDTPVFVLDDSVFEETIEMKEHSDKSLLKKIEYAGLWK